MNRKEDGRAHLRLEGVCHEFGEVAALRDVTFEAGYHERIALLGPSGCGKSTLLNIIGGLVQPSTGLVSIDGHSEARERLLRCALMPQSDLLLPWRSALDNACLALQNRGMRRRDARERARPLFERAGLGDFEAQQPSQLSGGMRQRVAFLRTLLAEKDALLLDEPFGALDSITRGEMQEWLTSVLEDTPRTLVLVTHDVEEALLLCNRVLVFSRRPGRIVLDLDASHDSKSTRRERIAAPEFVALKDRALSVLQ